MSAPIIARITKATTPARITHKILEEKIDFLGGATGRVEAEISLRYSCLSM